MNHAPHSPHSPARRVARLLALTPAIAGVLLAGPAWASAPDSWESQPKVNLLYAVLLLGGIAAGLFVLISLLVVLPGMVHHESYQPALSWRGGPEWFGGPRGGVEGLDGAAGLEKLNDPAGLEGRDDVSRQAIPSAEDARDHADRGGASARW